VAGPDKGSVVVVLGAAHHAPSAYDAICQRLHTASLRTIVIGPDPRLTAKSVVGILDALDVRWALLVGDRIGGELAWELAATRLDRFIGLVVIDRGHPRVADLTGVIRDEHCPPVEMNTTALVSTPAARAVAKASQRYVYGDFPAGRSARQAQRAGVHRAAGRRDRDAHQHLVTATAVGARSVSTPGAAPGCREQEVDESLAVGCGSWLASPGAHWPR
jgi:pimeloyl-ACP methyl ester carboxylesterase